VGPSARRDVEFADRDDADVAVDFGFATERKCGELLGVGEEGANGDVVIDHGVDERFRFRHGALVELVSIDVDRAPRLAESRRNGVGLCDVAERARQHVLPGVKRHVEATPDRVDLAVHVGADRGQRAFEQVMHHVRVVDLHVDDGRAGHFAAVGHLPA